LTNEKATNETLESGATELFTLCLPNIALKVKNLMAKTVKN